MLILVSVGSYRLLGVGLRGAGPLVSGDPIRTLKLALDRFLSPRRHPGAEAGQNARKRTARRRCREFPALPTLRDGVTAFGRSWGFGRGRRSAWYKLVHEH